MAIPADRGWNFMDRLFGAEAPGRDVER